MTSKTLQYCFVVLTMWICLNETAVSQAVLSPDPIRIARLKYDGGGDWYNDPSAEVNLLRYAATSAGIVADPQYRYVDARSDELFSYPMLFITGHGNIILSDEEAEKLRDYVERGGFIFADDDYGMDASFRNAAKKIFPDRELVELAPSHPLFSYFYKFPGGLPKTHEHDGKPPQAFAIYIGERMGLLYTYESNPSDGWVDASVHKTPEEKRQEALKFGTNLLLWVITH